jgi:hypothetical protein
MFPNVCFDRRRIVRATEHLHRTSYLHYHQPFESPLCLNKSDSAINVRRPLTVYSSRFCLHHQRQLIFYHFRVYFLMVQKRGEG